MRSNRELRNLMGSAEVLCGGLEVYTGKGGPRALKFGCLGEGAKSVCFLTKGGCMHTVCTLNGLDCRGLDESVAEPQKVYGLCVTGCAQSVYAASSSQNCYGREREVVRSMCKTCTTRSNSWVTPPSCVSDRSKTWRRSSHKEGCHLQGVAAHWTGKGDW